MRSLIETENGEHMLRAWLAIPGNPHIQRSRDSHTHTGAGNQLSWQVKRLKWQAQAAGGAAAL